LRRPADPQARSHESKRSFPVRLIRGFAVLFFLTFLPFTQQSSAQDFTGFTLNLKLF
jgi:hypothetical protein